MTSSPTSVALVTGGGGGIGSAIAKRLARSGAAVVVSDHDVSVDGSSSERSAAESVVEEISGVLVEDRAAFTAALGELLVDHERRERLGRGARVTSHAFTWAHAQESFATVVRAGPYEVPGGTPSGDVTVGDASGPRELLAVVREVNSVAHRVFSQVPARPGASA